MKQLAKFKGKVNQFNNPPEPSYVTLKNVLTGELCNTDAISEKLMEKGIGQSDEFEVIVQEDLTGKVEAILSKLEPKASGDDFNI
jgi:precorrin-6B methylase 1